jgi:hypothetical protein
MYTTRYDDGQFGPRARSRLDLGVAARGCAGIPSVDGVEFWTGGTADMMALTPVSLRSVALIAAGCDDIAIGAGVTLIEIARDKPDLPATPKPSRSRSPYWIPDPITR